jgi:putative SOS response-associated peptidase YedK
MCGRYYRKSDKQEIAEAFHTEATGDPLAYAPGYNIAPTTTQPVLRQQRDTFSRELVPMRWGLVGFGSKGIDPKRSTFNARAEGLEKNSLWNRPLHRHRCIVPMNGYYEWRKSDRQAFRFTVGDDNQLFGVAGLWDAWKSPEGDWLQSFTIITSDPNTISESIHNRMPTILQPKDCDEWLDRQEVERPPVHLLRPFDSSAMFIHSAHPKVGNVRNQGPEMLNSK